MQKIGSHSQRKSSILLDYHFKFKLAHKSIYDLYEFHCWCKIKLKWYILRFEVFWKGGQVCYEKSPHTRKIFKNVDFLDFCCHAKLNWCMPPLCHPFSIFHFFKFGNSFFFCIKNQPHTTVRSEYTTLWSLKISWSQENLLVDKKFIYSNSFEKQCLL